ncbi:MAG: hypothetical protein ACJ75J_02920 [Cytophagaceae bacterium]
MQEDDINDIDRLLREKFENFGSEPSPELWKKIAEKIPQQGKDKKPPFPWLGMMSILLIIGAIGTGIYFYYSGLKNEEDAVAVNGNVQNSNNQNTGISEQSNAATGIQNKVSVNNDSGTHSKNNLIASNSISADQNKDVANSGQANQTQKDKTTKTLVSNVAAGPGGNSDDQNKGKDKDDKTIKLQNSTTADANSTANGNHNSNSATTSGYTNSSKNASGTSNQQPTTLGQNLHNDPAPDANSSGTKTGSDSDKSKNKISDPGNNTRAGIPDLVSNNQNTSSGNTSSSARKNPLDSGMHKSADPAITPNNSAASDDQSFSKTPDPALNSPQNSSNDTTRHNMASDSIPKDSTLAAKDSTIIGGDSSQVKKEKKKLAEKFALSLSITPLAMLNNPDSHYHPQFNYMPSLAMHYQVSPKISISAGLSILNIRNKLLSSYQETSIYYTYDPLDSMHQNPQPHKTIIDNKVSARNHYSYIGIPVMARYQGKGEKLYFSLSLGLSPMFITKVRETYVTERGGFISEKSSFNSFNMSGMINCGIHYRISRRLILFAEPGLRYMMKNVHKQQNFGISKPLFLGIETGIKILF